MTTRARTERAPSWITKSDHTEKLVWRYGVDRALQIIAGIDDATNADLKAWRNLGRGKAA